MPQVVEIADPDCGATAQISVDRGFNCFSYQVDGHELLDAETGFDAGAGRPSGHGIPILFPFPNRIR
ncbi:MAG: aldose 1-epimerase, partial [Planctomycetota bacterium]|nr:aldose 1-epimerase [Planctomycetota bacterium]